MLLYHMGYTVIRDPDVHYGRKNADFGQGFYTTDDREFACRWAKESRGSLPVLNTYELDLSGLTVRRFRHSAVWYRYISGNRAGRRDSLPEADVIIGPIANDTIFDTLGIFTSGLLDPDASLRLLRIGPKYRQITLKTEKAAARLRWLSARTLNAEELSRYRSVLAEETDSYLQALSDALAEE